MPNLVKTLADFMQDRKVFDFSLVRMNKTAVLDMIMQINGIEVAKKIREISPDTIIISAGVYADLDANIGLDSIKGNINIDMPVWLDEIIKKPHKPKAYGQTHCNK